MIPIDTQLAQGNTPHPEPATPSDELLDVIRAGLTPDERDALLGLLTAIEANTRAVAELLLQYAPTLAAVDERVNRKGLFSGTRNRQTPFSG